MILPSPKDSIHKAWLYRILMAVADDVFLISVLRFKGGTCAAMRNLIERFSVDLDFDLIEEDKVKAVDEHLIRVFHGLGLEIKDHSQHVPQFFLRYQNEAGERSIIRFDVTFPAPRANEYEPYRFAEIDRIIYCQTPETMFANKLVALLERYERFGSIAGRDLFDIHTFFLKGVRYNAHIIEERRGTNVKDFFVQISNFIEKKVNQTVIDQDLNHLLPPEQFKKIRKYLIPEVLTLVKDELKRL